MSEAKVPMLIIVNGEDWSVEADPSELLSSVRDRVLALTKNTSAERAPGVWEFRSVQSGALLHPDRTIKENEIRPRDHIWLGLKAGWGG